MSRTHVCITVPWWFDALATWWADDVATWWSDNVDIFCPVTWRRADRVIPWHVMIIESPLSGVPRHLEYLKLVMAWLRQPYVAATSILDHCSSFGLQ